MTADPQARGEPSRRSVRSRRLVAFIALMLGAAGLAISLTGLAIQLLPRHFTSGQQQQIEAWEISGRWRTLAAGQIFPASVTYPLYAKGFAPATPQNLGALRVGIAAQSDCAGGVTTASAAAELHHVGCEAVLRATYIDVTRSYIMTVGVAVFPTAAAAVTADQDLSRPQLAAADDAGTDQLSAGVLVVRFHGPAAGLYDYTRQISKSFVAGPYLIMYAAGYADGRPRVPVTYDPYSYAAMTSLANGVARSVANTLAAPPAAPRCPGAPGC